MSGLAMVNPNAPMLGGPPPSRPAPQITSGQPKVGPATGTPALKPVSPKDVEMVRQFFEKSPGK
jgi:hypothetical protein